MSLESNMIIAAEACFEMDPTPIHEAWLEKLNSEQEICTKFVPSQTQKSVLYQACTKDKT